jgi:hypothetical protein
MHLKHILWFTEGGREWKREIYRKEICWVKEEQRVGTGSVGKRKEEGKNGMEWNNFPILFRLNNFPTISSITYKESNIYIKEGLGLILTDISSHFEFPDFIISIV